MTFKFGLQTHYPQLALSWLLAAVPFHVVRPETIKSALTPFFFSCLTFNSSENPMNSVFKIYPEGNTPHHLYSPPSLVPLYHCL